MTTHSAATRLCILALAGASATQLSPALAGPPSSVATTLHNLSASGPGNIRAISETRICIFCHTPHTAAQQTPLWNRQMPAGSFTTYASPTLDATDGLPGPQPEGASKLCLSCHDGTVAVGKVGSLPQAIAMAGTVGGRIPPTARGYVGHDLSGSHPVSIAVTPDLVARNNAKDSALASVAEMRLDPDVRLDGSDRLQCTTCHDAHNDGNFASSGVHFYAKPGFSDVCEVCHRL